MGYGSGFFSRTHFINDIINKKKFSTIYYNAVENFFFVFNIYFKSEKINKLIEKYTMI